jgi:negative regulator of flagellin synthesis FlgM
MKIGSLEAKPVVPAPASERKVGSAAAGTAAESGSAKVELSTAASLMARISDDPAFDAQKVERIASAIRDGRFTVNAEAIADKLIVNAEELLGRKLS